MSKRLEILSPNMFATFCIVVLEESERRGDVIEDDELYDLALGLSGENYLQAEAFCERFRGFIEMTFRPEAKKYVSNESGRMMFHPALFEAAACARTRKNGRFPERPFFKHVTELAAGKYSDFTFDL